MSLWHIVDENFCVVDSNYNYAVIVFICDDLNYQENKYSVITDKELQEIRKQKKY